MGMRHRRKIAVPLLIGVLLLVALGGVLGVGLWRRAEDPSRTPHNTLAGLRALPEDQLLYPGAVVLGRYGGDPYRSWGSGLNAHSGTYVGVNATEKQVLMFYDTELQRLGWTKGPNRGGLSTEMAGLYWDHDDLMLKVGILYNDQPDSPPPAGGHGVYHGVHPRFVVCRPGLVCHRAIGA